jgi:hypothetical protein
VISRDIQLLSRRPCASLTCHVLYLCAGSGMAQAELQASAEWAAATLEATQCAGGPDPSHAASCAAIAQVLRELAAAGAQEGETLVEAERTRPATNTISR